MSFRQRIGWLVRLEVVELVVEVEAGEVKLVKMEGKVAAKEIAV